MNKVILMGRLTRDPELRYAAANTTAWATFTLAVNRKFTKQGEEKQADFINIVAFGKTAEFCSKYFTKGQQVAVSGRIQTRTWDDQDGKKRYATDVVAEDVYFADSRRDGHGGGDSNPYDRMPFPKQPQDAVTNDDFFTDDDNENDVPF